MISLIESLGPVFHSILRASWQASFLIAAILFVQYVFRNYLTARWRYGLWFLAVARLVMPGLPESYFSVFNLLPSDRAELSSLQDSLWATQRKTMEESTGSGVVSEPALSLTAHSDAFYSVPISQTSPLMEEGSSLSEVTPVIWGMGMIIFLAFVLGQLITVRVCLRNLPPVTNPAILDVFTRCMSKMRLHRAVRLVDAPRMDSPALYGLLHPVLLLPEGMATSLGTESLRYIFLHELAHVKQRDIWVNWLIMLLRAIHWFNPLVWYAFRRMRTDQELACDALALSYTHEGESIEYGKTIVTLLERSVMPQRLPGTAGIIEDTLRMRRRIEMITAFKKPGPAWTVLTVVIVAALGLGLLTEGRTVQTEGTATAAGTSEGTVVTFPERSVGDVLVREKGSLNEEDWTFYADAKGEVTLPKDNEVQILFSWFYHQGLDFLKTFPPDSIQVLYLHNGRPQDGDLEVLARFTTLSELIICNAEISDVGLAHLASIKSLHLLWLGNNRITFQGIESIAGLTGLTNLNISKAQLGDEGIVSLQPFTKLKTLNIEAAGITGAGLGVLKELSGLEELNAGGNSLSGGGLAVLSQLPHLRKLILKDAQIDDADMQFIKGLTSLQELDLSGTGITDVGLGGISVLTSLNILNLEGTQVTDAGLPSLSGLTGLKSLILNKTRITDSGLTSLTPLTALSKLEVFGTVVTDQGLDQLGQSLAGVGVRNPEAPKVGLIFSHVSANNPRFMASPNGYTYQEELARLFRNLHLNVYALIDPGSEDRKDLKEVLSRVGLVERMIPVTDVEKLKGLDVIASSHDPNQLEAAIRAIGVAVSSGVGFFNQSGFAQHSPGYTQDVKFLLGIENGAYNYRPSDYSCKVIATHPVLGLLEPGDQFWICVENGFSGTVNGTPLLAPPSGSDPNFCPLYVRQCGEGRVVACQWLTPFPRNTAPYTNVEFVLRCINWAAKRPVDAKW